MWGIQEIHQWKGVFYKKRVRGGNRDPVRPGAPKVTKQVK